MSVLCVCVRAFVCLCVTVCIYMSLFGLRPARTFFDIQWAAGARTALYIWAANEHYMFAGEVNTVDGKTVGSYIVDYPAQASPQGKVRVAENRFSVLMFTHF